MSMTRTNKVLTGILCLGIAATGTQVAYGMGQSSAKAAWARGLTLCLDRTAGTVSYPKGGKCSAGSSPIQLATSSQLVAAIDSVDRSGTLPTPAPTSGTSDAQISAAAPTATVYVTGPAGPQGAPGAVGPTGPAGSGGGAVGCSLAAYPNYSNASLDNCTIIGLSMVNTTWTNAHLSGASLLNVDAQNSDFTGADLSHANLTGSRFSHPSSTPGLDGANVTGVDFTKVSGDFTLGGTHIQGLGTATLTPFMRTVRNDPSYGDVILTDFISAPGIDLRNVDLSNRTLSGVNFDHADFRGANLVNFYSSQYSPVFTYANFHGVSLAGSALAAGDLSHADLSGVTNAINTNLTSNTMHSVNLSGANLSQGYLNGSDLTGSNLSGTILNGTQLYGTNLHGVTGTIAPLDPANLPYVAASTRCRDNTLFAGDPSVLVDIRICINGS